MPCPFIQLISDGMESDDDSNSIIDELSISTTVQNGTNNHHEIVNEPLNYTTYLHTDILFSALKCLSHIDRSNNSSPAVHDEHFFILIHQVFELWFKQILFEIDSIRSIFDNNGDFLPYFFITNLRLNRIAKIWSILIDQLQLLESMTPMEFLEFRDFITPASGFQSLQFRLIEIKLGLTDQFRNSYKTKYFTQTMFNGEQTHQLEIALQENSLLCQIERWLEKIYDNTSFSFHDVFTSAIQNMIEYEKQKQILNGIDVETVERTADITKQKFDKMIDPNEYKKLLENNERRISQKAMLSVLMIAHYYQEPCFQHAYEILNSLIDINNFMSTWRYKHIILVQRQIGRKRGTGGTEGFSYLQETMSEKYQVFIDLCNVSSYLIPRRFLPKFVDKSTIPATTISSIAFQLNHETPTICKQQSYNPKYQSSQDQFQYYQIPFFLLVFVSGFIFAALIGRFMY